MPNFNPAHVKADMFVLPIGQDIKYFEKIQ